MSKEKTESWKGNDALSWRDKTGLLKHEQGLKACVEFGRHDMHRKDIPSNELRCAKKKEENKSMCEQRQKLDWSSGFMKN